MKNQKYIPILLLILICVSQSFAQEKVAVTIKPQGEVENKKEEEKKIEKDIEPGSSLENKDKIAEEEESSAQEKVAVTIKSRGEVKYKKEKEKKFEKDLEIGNSLENRDEIAVGKKSFASIIFIDDKSMLNIHENTNFVVRRDQKNSKIIKRISLEYGRLRANVHKDMNNEFIISTPTSVAAVKGTIFWVISDEKEGDTFFGVEGSVEITNLISNKKILVAKNEKGTSNQQGELDKTQVSDNDLPKDEESDGESKVIRIPFENENGETKYLEIHYKE